MNLNELMVDNLARNLEMIQGTLGDFSDADMLVRPAPGANHAAWQLGHFTSSEFRMIEAVKPNSMPALPAGFAEKYTKQSAASEDPRAFDSKSALLEAFSTIRQGTIRWARSLTPEEMDRPTPERLQRFAATVGQLSLMIPIHTTMHLGQFQVIRRKLGKPFLM